MPAWPLAALCEAPGRWEPASCDLVLTLCMPFQLFHRLDAKCLVCGNLIIIEVQVPRSMPSPQGTLSRELNSSQNLLWHSGNPLALWASGWQFSSFNLLSALSLS